MSRFRFTLCAAASALAVLGCATPTQQGLVVKPMQTVRHGAGPEANYAIGRYFQGQLRYEDAINAYRQALAAQPGHVGALNALGVIYSLQKRPELAEQHFRAALAVAPGDSQVLNNLGYHLLSNARVAEAVQAFEQARAADPANTTVVANLAAAQAQLGALPAPVVVEAATAATPPPAPAPAPAIAPPPAPAMATAAPAAAAVPVAAPTAAAAVTTAAAAQPAAAAPGAHNVAPAATPRLAGRIEISNGNGATGLAMGVSHLLAAQGAGPARLTNDKPYGVVRSSIQFVAGAEQEARQINQALPVPLPLTQVASLQRKAPVRVLLGKDFPPATVIAQVSTRRAS
jgi:Flp pilus assembly protein TadD